MIAYSMLYTAAVGLPVTLAALAVSAVLRKHGRPERLVWLAALVTALVLPAVGLLDPFTGGQTAALPLPATGVIGLPATVVVPAETSALGVESLLVVVWLLASGLLALRWAVAAFRLVRASRSWRATTVDSVRVWTNEKLGPAVAGTLRPRVLVPRWLLSLPASQRTLVLLHEQEHIRARDPMLIALSRLTRVLVPWNPAVWLIGARLVRAVELDCDRRVLSRTGDVAAYGRTLLTVSERRPGRLVAAAAFAESEAPLRGRILAMTTPARTLSLGGVLAGIALGVVLLAGACEVPVPTEASAPDVAGPGEPMEPNPAIRERGERVTDGSEQEAAAGLEPSSGFQPSEPPSAAETIRGLREQRAARSEYRSEYRSLIEGRALPGVQGEPSFTPYTVAPRLLNRADVVDALVRGYPALLRDAGIGGTIGVYFYIGEDGVVRDARLAERSGHQALDEAALDVASMYRFTPALNGSEPTAVWVRLPITFNVR